jgi:hypothetical protein
MSERIISKQVLIAGLIFGISLCGLVLFFQILVAPNIIIKNDTRMQVNITPVPPELMTQNAVNNSSVTLLPSETPFIPGVYANNMVIMISGTEGEGLNVRENPGTDSPIVYLAQEGETYKITDGPQIKDGLIWWHIDQTAEGQKTGWAVQDYFAPATQ